jgi:hypothetical protein
MDLCWETEEFWEEHLQPRVTCRVVLIPGVVEGLVMIVAQLHITCLGHVFGLFFPLSRS